MHRGPLHKKTLCLARILLRLSTSQFHDESIDIQFIFKYLIHFHKYFESVAVGATAKFLRLRHFEDLPFPLPPLAEQECIVAILDEAFDAIATAKANTEKNLQNARELFDSVLANHFANDWEEKKLGEVCRIGDGNHSSKYPKSDEIVSSGVPFIRSVNLVDGRLSATDVKYITKEKHETLKKGHLKTGDVLFTNRGEIGKVAIVDERFDNANLNSQIAWFRCHPQLNNRFLLYYLISPRMKSHFAVSKNGAALQQFTIRQISDLSVTLPPLDEQQSIVAKLDELSAETKKLESIYHQKLADLDELKKPMLHNAFSGHLR